MNKIILIITLLTVSTANLFSQVDFAVKYATTITLGDLKKHLTIIASDSFEGRNTGEAGQKLAAHYIANQFQDLGLAPKVKVADSLSFFQPFNVSRLSWDSTSYIKFGTQKLDFFKDFFSLSNTNIYQEQTMELIYGDGLENSNKNQVKGKCVVICLERFDKDQIIAASYNKKYKQLLDSGALAVFIIPGVDDQPFHNFIKEFKCEMEEPLISMSHEHINYANVFFILPSLGADMLGLSATQMGMLQKQESDLRKANPMLDLKPIEIKANKKLEILTTENVLGYIEGSDLKDELIVITAHYDHQGIICGEIYNGADDDGSGTVAVLELAQAFSLAKKEGHGPRRSILFMTVTGEEKGLLGSSYYTSNPVFPLVKTVVDLNIDMIGRIDGYHTSEDYVYLIGSDRLSTDLHNLSEDMNRRYTGINLDYTYNKTDDPNQFYYRSDHYNFAKNNIPVIFYFSGTHQDYHQPTDDIDKILFSKIEKTTRLVFHTAWELANRTERIRLK